MAKEIDTGKSMCSMDFPSRVSKLCSGYLCVPMRDVSNHCLFSGVFPDIWKRVEIIPLEKTKSSSSPSDFRPILLLWHLGVIERAIMFLYTQSVLPTIGHEQLAYQKGKSTTDAILSAVNLWTEMLDQSIPSIPVVFLDMSKEFDRIDEHKRIQMLTGRSINGKLATVIHSFLPHRNQYTGIGNSKSAAISTTNGTPQGTLLGPMFWLLYIDNLLPSCKVITYADDLTVTPKVDLNIGDRH